jgi:hypothetical protein
VDSPAGTPEMRIATDPVYGRAATSGEATLLTPATFDPIARYRTKPHGQDYWIKQWIGPGGGTVDFLGFRIIVPAGAVDKVTMFQIRIPGENDPDHQEHVYAEFQPHNVTFRVPVRIELPYANTDAYGSPSGVMWYQERSKTWTSVGGGITADGQRVWVDTPHFSTYGTMGGGIAQGSGG